MTSELTDLFGEKTYRPTAAAVGGFDGVHLGHQHLLRDAVCWARKQAAMPVAITFDPLPAQYFSGSRETGRILTRDEQVQMLRNMGMERVIVLSFSRKLADLSPEAFLHRMKETLQVEKLFMGSDFTIGKNRAGTPKVISEIGSRMGFEVEVLEKDRMDGADISSTRIRGLLRQGNVSDVNRLLGYSWFFQGEVIHGDHRARTMGYPTMNILYPQEKVQLLHGVYASVCEIDGKKYPSITNIGLRPTFYSDNSAVLTESHLLNQNGDFYGKLVKVMLLEKIREEKRFDSIDSLTEQIHLDADTARNIHRL